MVGVELVVLMLPLGRLRLLGSVPNVEVVSRLFVAMCIVSGLLLAKNAGAQSYQEKPSEAEIGDSVVIVKRDESLFQFCTQLFMSGNFDRVEQIVDWVKKFNDLHTDSLISGQTLRVPFSQRQLSSFDPIHDARGIYVNASVAGSPELQILVDKLLLNGGNTIVFDVKDRSGTLSYRSSVGLAVTSRASKVATIENPDRLIELLHQKDLHVIARLTCFYDEHLAAAHPQLRPRSRDEGFWPQGKRPGWLDPSLPKVQDYLVALALEVADMGVDEVQLDYVRFPTEGDLSKAVFAYEAEISSKPKVITQFVKRVRDALNGRVLLSADVFGVVVWGREVDIQRIGQNLATLLPLLDVVSPMVYPSHFQEGFYHIDHPVVYPYFLVHRACSQLLPQTESHGIGIRPWLQAFPYHVPEFDVTYVEEQLRAAEDSGANGWLLWNPDSRYSESFPAMRKVIAGTKPNSDVVQARDPHGTDSKMKQSLLGDN